MKTKFIFLLFTIISSFAFGQDLKVNVPEVKVTPPKFTGIEIKKAETPLGILETYVRDNLQYPDRAYDYYNEGTEVVQFVITPTGEVTDFTVVNSVSLEIDDEVIRVLKTTSGMWTPGYNNDQPVAMEKEISIVFKPEGSRTDFLKTGQTYFKKGGTLLLVKDNPRKAVREYNKAFVLLPSDKSLLIMRGLAKFETGDKDGACRDWTRIKALGGNQGDVYLDSFCEMKGYAEMIKILDE